MTVPQDQPARAADANGKSDGQPIRLRPGTLDDARTIAALAIQVFCDTYATGGIRPDLALEAFNEYGEARFRERLSDPGRGFVLAELGSGLVGFAEQSVCSVAMPPAHTGSGAELIRLYVQPRFQGAGLGWRLLTAAEDMAWSAGASALWLTAWAGNARALAFYRRCGYDDVGRTEHVIEGIAYENRVLARRLPRVRP